MRVVWRIWNDLLAPAFAGLGIAAIAKAVLGLPDWGAVVTFIACIVAIGFTKVDWLEGKLK